MEKQSQVMMPENPEKVKSKRGFASMSRERQREIASMGGKASGGNFANSPERAAEEGRKGGQVSGGNFKNDRARAAKAGAIGGGRRALGTTKGK